jgi:hypothetical protein
LMETRGRVKRSKDEQSNTSHCDEQKWPSDLHGVASPSMEISSGRHCHP